MKKIYSTLLLFYYSISLLSQIPVEYNHAPNGKIIIDDYHTFLNNEYASVEMDLEHGIETYEKGVFKLKSSKEEEKSYIKLALKNISVKKGMYSTEKISKHSLEDVEYFKLGVDSFFITKKIKNLDKIIERAAILKHIAIFDTIQYAQYYTYSRSGTLSEKFFVEKTPKSASWTRIVLEGEPLKKNFFMSAYGINRFIDKKELTEKEFLGAIKEIQYLEKIENGENIFFDKTWQEVRKGNKAKYIGKIITKKDSIYTFDFFNTKNQKLFQVNYSSFNPNKKTGKMSIYREGVLNVERIYTNDSLNSMSLFYASGELKFREINKLIKKPGATKKVIETYCVNLMNTNSENLITSNNKNVQMSYGETNVTHVLEDKKIKETYYTENDSKVYFYGNRDKKIETSKFKTALKTFLYSKEAFKKARLNSNLEGTILLDIKTDYKGRIVDYKIVNSLNNDLDKIFFEFCEEKLSDKAQFTIRFKNIRLDDKSDYCRFLLPISFVHKRSYNTFPRASYNYMHHDMMFQQQMMQNHQQMMNRNFNF